jgi:hypothetical protein
MKDWVALTNPFYVRIAIFEFSVLWLTYLAVGIGIFDRTFGMWVWGLHVQYGANSQDSVFLKKVFRIFSQQLEEKIEENRHQYKCN